MSWALRRQIIYITVVVLFVGIFGFLVIRPHLKHVVSCFDNTQNGNETGVDCGGSCAQACISQVDPVSVLWARSFKVVGGRYNAVAYLENHNRNTAVNKINYRFRFADENNVYIGKRDGSTYIPPSGKFAVFEPAIDIGNSIPVYTTFEFTEVPDWIQVSQDKINQLKILTSNITLTDVDTAPVLSATIKNNSLINIPEINVVVILYDAGHNAVSASRTYLDHLAGEEESNIDFTWRESLEGKVVAEEIIPEFNIFNVGNK